MAATEAALNLNHVREYIGADFTVFYAAGALARHGLAAGVYTPATIAAAEHAARFMPADSGNLPFYYPPPYLLLCWLLACLPYWVALTAFLAVPLGLILMAARTLAPIGTGLLPVFAFPGLLVSARTGQNGLLSAACFAGFAALADRRPWLAGACLGVLACKPQLAVCAPLALLAAGRWRSTGGAAVTFLGLCLVSFAGFGVAPWVAFLEHIGGASANITVGIQDRAKIMSAFNAARLFGAGLPIATAVQLAVAVPALATLLLFARRKPDGPALGGALAATSLLVTPYVMDYDLMCLGPALAAGATAGVTRGFLPGDKIMLLAAYMLPLVAHDIAETTRLQIAPMVVGALLFVLVRARAGALA
jgi:hypothetical protein